MKKPLTGNRIAIALFNRNSENKTITVFWKDLEIEQGTLYAVSDVWKHASAGQAEGTLSADLQAHECQVFVLST